MVALKTERRVFLWRIRPHCEPEDAGKLVTLAELAAILENEYQNHRARAYLSGSHRFIEDDDEGRDEKNQLYIADIKADRKSNTLTILINRGDPNVVATAYLDTRSNKVRTPPAKRDETPGYSAHLVLSLAPDKSGQHRAAFEQMTRIPGSLALNLLNRIAGRAVKGNRRYMFMIPVKTKQKIGSRPHPYRPALTMQRVPSERLIDDLQKGELSGVTLTKRSVSYSGPGRENLVRQSEEKLTLKTVPADPSLVESFMRALDLWAKQENYDAITFHLENLPHGSQANPTIALIEDEEALEQLYVRVQILDNFQNFLEACYPQICTDIQGKMIATIVQGHGW